jgi:Flp pilus assembly protein TadD
MLKLVRMPNDVIAEETVVLGSLASFISVVVPRASRAEAPAATISVERLRHPLTSKAARLLRKAQILAAAGDHPKAIETLQHALSEASAIPYVHSMLGVEYLKTGRVAQAEEELEQAVRLLPEDSVNHSNLGYALYLAGDAGRSEQEVRRALEIDRSNSPAQKMLNYFLSSKK